MHTSRWPVNLGGIEFWSREELFHFFGLLLSSSPTQKPLRGRDRKAVLALLDHHKVQDVSDRVLPSLV